MRFFEDGPDIPDTLIEGRDLGEVVFFCGAGISGPAGLPNFGGLADDLLNRLAAQESREARNRQESLDRVFTAMIKEFGGAAVDREMTRALRTPRHADLRYHRAVIDLSRGADGVAKIVTTNFDLLFERADRSLRAYVPPALPDLAQLQPIQGIVYLHGRLNRAGDARAGYVINSADFGRAYLAEGWATRFVRGLSERYTIVLLGYSANDPPMRYLLEGLNSREESSRRSLIYAFAPEGAAAADESWRDKGVTTIPYTPRDTAHSGLWDSLFAWADAARDQDAWRAKLVTLAQAQPAELKPFERGQVAHLVSTKSGASAFASADPRPPAQWLCVFDANRRYAKPGRLDWRKEAEVDPLEVFGLDSDPPRPEPRPSGGIEAPGEDLIRWRRGDQNWADRQRLSGYHADWTNQLPGRLYHLARWLGEVMNQPAAIWWAAANPQPHPGLVREIRNRLDGRDTLHPAAKHFWQCYLEACRAQAEDLHDMRRYELAERVQAEGWSKGVLRELERILAPAFAIGRASLSAPVPPSGDWDTLDLRNLVEIKVTVSSWPEDRLRPPSEMLGPVVALVRRSLERMSEMLEESTTLYWRTPTLHPTGERGESFHFGRKASHFLRFKELFEALAAHDLAAARSEVEAWDSDDPVFFAKLFLYAATLLDVVEARETARRILAMPDSVFWDSNLTRELLFALRAKWSAFGDRDRRRLERRVLGGPPPHEDEMRKEHKRRRSAESASWLRWLELHGCALSPATMGRLPKLMAADPRWSDSWAWHADDSHGPWGGTIERVTTPQGLESAPITQLVMLATALSTDDHRQLRDYRPFDGVVEMAPLRALAALRVAARRGEHPTRFWHSLIDNWPSDAKPQLGLLLAHTLSRLPDATFGELRHGIASWAQKFIGALIGRNRRAGFAAFDAIVARYLAADPATLASAVGFSTVSGVPQEKSEVSLMKAINAPGGKLVQVLLDQLNQPKRRRQMPAPIGLRLDRLLHLPGDGGGHAACVLARQFRWLNYWFSDWAAARLLPRFELDNRLSEAMWHGLASDHQFLGDAAGRLLKPALLRLLMGNAPWEIDKEARRRLIQQMTNLTMARGGERAVISFAEARHVLMAVSDEDRAGALALLARSMNPDTLWTSLIRPFLLNAWPRQLRYQDQLSSRQLALIAEKAGDRFPEVVEVVLPFLRPVAHLDTFAFRLKKQDEDGQGYSARFPLETLRLLDPLVGNDPQTVPWNLGELLEAIAEADPALRQSDPWRRLKTLTQ